MLDAPQYNINRQIIPALADLEDSAGYRFIALHGGRGGAKSHFFAEEAIERMACTSFRIACLREHQNSLRESARQLLIDKIEAWGVQDLFDITETEIRGAFTGSLAIFKGMKSFNADSIKSLAEYDCAWFEEAQTASERSLRILFPTVLRKDGAQIWLSWNDRYETDAVSKRFVEGVPPPRSYIKKLTWRDNPLLNAAMREQVLHDYATDPDMAMHVWGGNYEIVSDASYYAKWIKAAEDEGRVGDFAHDKVLPVMTAWDIGVDDYTAIWFLQEDGRNVTVLDYWETQNEGAEDIVDAALPEYHVDVGEGARQMAKIERPAPFRYDRHFFPHDVRVREWGAGARSRVETLMALGVEPIHKGANTGPEERINATRKLLPLCRFRDTPRVRLGLRRLRRYSRRFNEAMQTWAGPLHDDNSHGADAFGEYAVNCPLVGAPPVDVKRAKPPPGAVVLPGPPEPRKGFRIKI